MATVGQLTEEQVRIDQQAIAHLVRGRYYDFEPAIEATGIPTGGKDVCPRLELEKILTFSRGWYIGYVNNRHVFQSYPVNDQREIPVPSGYDHEDMDDEDIAELVAPLRACYFHVAFLGGSAAVLSSDQSHN